MFNGATNFYNLNNDNFHDFLMEMYRKIDLLDKDTNYIRKHLIDELRKELRKIIANGELVVDIESVVDDFLRNGLAENKVVTDIKKKLEECSTQLDTNTKQMINKRIENVFGNNKCILHRGACTIAPEQTTASFQLAKKLGVKVVEIDVWKTADNDFVVFHDSTLDDKTTGTGRVEDKTLAELKTLSFTKGANLDKYPNLKILSFDECMKLLKELGLNALIDFKTYTLDSSIYLKLINIIKANGMLSNVAIATWYGSQIKIIRDLEKDICLGIEQVENETEWNYILNNNIDFAFLTKGTHLTQENIKRLHDNYRYCVGFSVNTLDDIKTYTDYGCDYFVTDNIFEGGI
ncbi:MAG: glycerophosphodiester phosphodiesterase family protein [Bacilli bacterium]|nr:glycerophosphodiester phosphodiesterase family protein [Bacilli bacterium]